MGDIAIVAHTPGRCCKYIAQAQPIGPHPIVGWPQHPRLGLGPSGMRRLLRILRSSCPSVAFLGSRRTRVRDLFQSSGSRMGLNGNLDSHNRRNPVQEALFPHHEPLTRKPSYDHSLQLDCKCAVSGRIGMSVGRYAWVVPGWLGQPHHNSICLPGVARL